MIRSLSRFAYLLTYLLTNLPTLSLSLSLYRISHLEKEHVISGKKKGEYTWEKSKSWMLLILGSIFAAYGTQSSVADIIRIYRDGDANSAEAAAA